GRVLAQDTREDSVAVIAAVLDEDLVRVITGDDNAGNKNSTHRRLERRGIVFRNSSLRIDWNIQFAEQVELWSKPGHHIDESCLQLLFIIRSRYHDGVALDVFHTTV